MLLIVGVNIFALQNKTCWIFSNESFKPKIIK